MAEDNVTPIRKPHHKKGVPLTPEEKEKMRAGYQAYLERKRAEKEAAKAETEKGMVPLKPQAIQRLRDLLHDPNASATQLISAAKLVLEYTDGKPTQRVEFDNIGKVEYILAPWEPVVDQASGE